MDYQKFIVRDPKICRGQPVIKGTRVTIRTILASLAEGACSEEILEDFPTLKDDDVRAVIAFAAISTEEDLPVLNLPNLDFSDIRKFKPGTHHGLLLIRLHNPGRRVLKERITKLFESENTKSWNKCFIVATNSKIRIKQPNHM